MEKVALGRKAEFKTDSARQNTSILSNLNLFF